MARRIRMLMSVAILIGVVGWIVLSYLPPTFVSLPHFAYASDGFVRFFPGMIVAGFLAFIGLQVWLVRSTARSVRRFEASANDQAAGAFELSISREVVLTALPIVFTVALALASKGWWQSLALVQ